MRVSRIKLRQILDSRGNPTVEAEVYLPNGAIGRGSSPSGASTGKYEAIEKRDRVPELYRGRSVERVIEEARKELVPNLLGQDFKNQREFDRELIKIDGTTSKARFGANVILAISIAYLRASTNNDLLYKFFGDKETLIIPKLLMNLINGGAHADNGLKIQEFMIVPDFPFPRSLQCGCEIFYALKAILKEKKFPTSVGDEGGFVPFITTSIEALDLLKEAVIKAGYSLGRGGGCVGFAIDVAASEIFKEGCYEIETGKKLRPYELIAYYKNLIDNYPLVLIEDSFDQDDFDTWRGATKVLGSHTILVGDDLFVSQIGRLMKGIEARCANAILVKPNQVGTVTEAFEVIECAKEAGYKVILSHRSG